MEKRRFLHICYNAGAALILIGAMFKILHLPYGNQILMIAMSAEAVIFLLAAFDYQTGETRSLSGDSPDKAFHDPQLFRRLESLQSKMQEMQQCMEELNSHYLFLMENRKEEQDHNENEEEILI